jgi:hypothetical protein
MPTKLRPVRIGRLDGLTRRREVFGVHNLALILARFDDR